MSSRDRKMSFFGALPKPLNFENKRETERIGLSNPAFEMKESVQSLNKEENSAEDIKFINYEITLENLNQVCRDLSLPFDFLLYFYQRKNIKYSETDQQDNYQMIIEKKAKLAEIQLQILYRVEKRQPLSNIPNVFAKFLAELDYNLFSKICQSFMNVVWTWVEAIQKSKPRRVVKKFYSTPNRKTFCLEKMIKCLEKLFFEGYESLQKPSFMELGYIQFLDFLKTHSISFSGPFESNFNGQKLISIFVVSNYNALRFFNHNSPLFGIFEFEPITNKENFEQIPKWFLDPPAINNFAIDSMLSNFERISFV